MNDCNWPDLKYRTVSQFIYTEVRKYEHRLDESESIPEAWRAYLEAEHAYPLVAGCCPFPAYAAFRIRESLELLRRHRNERISLESTFSLDSQFDGASESIGARYFGTIGDCYPRVALWDYAWRLGLEEYRIVRLLSRGLDDREIMEEEGLSPRAYYAILSELQEAFRKWLLI